MTVQKSFKRLVRARAEKTGESYTAARAALLASSDDAKPSEGPKLTISDDAIRDRTGRGWEEWFDLLDEAGALEKTHPEVVRWLQDEQGTDGWSAQSITVSYERARGGRAIGQKDDGLFSVTASKTVAVPVERLFDAFVDEALRSSWLGDARLSERSVNRPRGARFDWGDGSTRLVAGFESKGEAKSMVGLAHEKLPDADEAERMKQFWRERVATLKEVLER